MVINYCEVYIKRSALLILIVFSLLIVIGTPVSATPIAVIGGPYEGNEGTSITLSAAGSSDPDGGTLNYRWDFTNDGVWDTTWSASPTVSYTYWDDFHGLVKVQVSNSVTSLKAETTAQIDIYNVAPVLVLEPIRTRAFSGWLPQEIVDMQIDFGPYPLLHTGERCYLGHRIYDPSRDQPYHWTLDDGNGHVTTGLDYNNSLPFAHLLQYDTPGIFTITLTVTDGDGGEDSESVTVKVNDIANFIYSPSDPSLADIVQFTDTSSSPNGPIETWIWWDDLTYEVFSQDQNPTHQFSEYNDNYVGLIVIDSAGEASIMYKEIDVDTGLTAGFTYTPVNPVVGEPIQFTSTSTCLEPISEYYWDFGDGDYTDDWLENPTHTYAEPGEYQITLWVYDSPQWGYEDSITQTITVLPLDYPKIDIVIEPVRTNTYWAPEDAGVDFGPYPLAHTGERIYIGHRIYDSSGDTPYQWTLDDGNGHITTGLDYNNSLPFAHYLQYDSPGLYTVTLTVNDNIDGCEDAESVTIKVNDIADFTYSPVDPSLADEIKFADTSSSLDGPIVSWVWYDDLTGMIFSRDQNPTYQFTEYGDNYVGLIVIDSAGEASIMYKEIDVDTGLTAGFTYTPSNPIVGEPIQFTNTATCLEPISEYWWDFGDGDYTDEDLPNPTHYYSEPGEYQVTLWVYDNWWGYEDSITQTLIVQPSGSSPTAAYTYSPVAPTTADIVTFMDVSTDSDGIISAWSWDFGDGSPPAQGAEPSHRFATPGTYSVTLTVTDNDERTDTITQILTVPAYEAAVYEFDAPGTTITGQQIIIDSIQAAMEGASVSTSGNLISITYNGLIATITTSQPVISNGGIISGEIVNVNVQSQPLPGDFSSTGPIEALFAAEFTAFIEDASISATLQETPDENVFNSFQLAATTLDMVVQSTAYVMVIEKTNIPADAINSATIQMTASADWVMAQGGPDAIRIVRYDAGVATFLDTTGIDLGNGLYQFTAQSPGFSVFGLIGLNHIPKVESITTPLDPVRLDSPVVVSAVVLEPDMNDEITAILDWGDGSTSSGMVSDGTIAGSHIYATVGVYTISVSVTDGITSAIGEAPQYTVVYDPDAGFVTGGGWINSPAGAYTADQSMTGKANFGFVSKYQKGATVPSGQTQFEFKAAEFTFHSTNYEWLVIAGTRAQFKGSGTVNSQGDYGFMLTGVDGTPDLFRLKVWEKGTEEIIYDNQLGAEDSAELTTVISGGSIVIHKK